MDLFKVGLEHHQAGRLEQAETAYCRLIEVEPNHSAALANMGVLYLQRFEHTLGVEWKNKAIACLNASLQINGQQANLHANLVSFYVGQRDLENALAHYRLAIELGESSSALHLWMGALLLDCGLIEDALGLLDAAIKANPGEVNAWYNRGNALRLLRRFEEALVSYRRCLRLQPDHAEAQINMGVLHQDLKNFDEAVACYDMALALRPNAINACYNRALALENMGRFDEAVAGYAETLKLSPAYPYLVGRMHHARMQMCDWVGFNEHLSMLCSAVESCFPASVPFPFLAIADNLELQRVCAETYVKDKFPEPKEFDELKTHLASGRIRVGYFSSDFRTHAVGFLTAGLFENHDRELFEIFAISLAVPPEGDLYTSRIKGAVEHWIDISAVPDSEAVDQLRALRLDIAIDLAGHTMDARTGIFAKRVAPLQVNYLGYPGSMGSPYMDVILADEVVIPIGMEPAYPERVVHLPVTFQINDRQRQINQPQSRVHYSLPEEGFVFASFNTSYKINPPLFDIWCGLLQAKLGSVLWLFGENEAQMANLRREAAARGVTPDRLVFSGRLPYADHLGRYAHVDLVLDTLPFNGGTSTSDALWGGAPVLTCMGNSFAARMSASLLRAVGLPELITTSLAEYEALGKTLAMDADRLAAIKGQLKANRLQCPLFDTLSQTRDIENAYRRMVEKRS